MAWTCMRAQLTDETNESILFFSSFLQLGWILDSMFIQLHVNKDMESNL